MWFIRSLFPVFVIVIVVAWLRFWLGGWFAGAHAVHVAIEILARWTILDVSLCKRYKWQNEWEKNVWNSLNLEEEEEIPFTKINSHFCLLAEICGWHRTDRFPTGFLDAASHTLSNAFGSYFSWLHDTYYTGKSPYHHNLATCSLCFDQQKKKPIERRRSD